MGSIAPTNGLNGEATWLRLMVPMFASGVRCRSTDADRQLPRAPHLPAGPEHGVGIGQLEGRERVEPGFERHSQFHSGEVRPGAAVDAETERSVAVLLAVD